jgi:hypothetical protein
VIDLQNLIWAKLEGGYRIPYDVSVPLKLLEQSDNKELIESIWRELWNELHHQGDVGLASYLAIPQMARIAKSKKYFDSNLIGLCTIIEQQRHQLPNPVLPEEYIQYYLNGLRELTDIILDNIGHKMDDETYKLCLAGLATFSGRINLGKAILNLDEDVLIEFLKNF